ncbi:hypothetical protein [Neorhizobium huautlense]|uniref:hypothetical protein n=1 Tax=Neorhizobium huautlense TaxID=67774 RepID=UPI000CF9682C|nr:hypothetical protein [Neorhizobium huautlense]
MIESISGAAEAPSPSSPATAARTPTSTAAAIAQTLAVEQVETAFLGTRQAATRYASETAALANKSTMLHARSLEAVDDVVVRNLLDSLSPASRIIGSFFLTDGEDPAPKSLIATYYEDV